MARDREDRRRRGLRVLGWRDVPDRRLDARRRPRARVDAGVPAGASSPKRRRRGHRARAPGVRARASASSTRSDDGRRRSTSRRCRAARSSTRACSPRRSSREFYPDLARRARRDARSRSCTRGSPRTRSRPGRSRTRTGTRAQRRDQHACRATRTGCAPARRCWRADLLPGDLERVFPICTPGASDTARFDEALELLHLGGRPLPHAILMMIPEAWENHESMDAGEAAFYRYHASLMEPWDGPASIAFTDGTVIGAVLDRNGLRPSRYWVTDDDRVIMASEVGVLDVDPAKVVKKGRLEPGRMFLVDTTQGRIIPDDEIKAELAARAPVPGVARRGPRPPRRPAAASTSLVPQHSSAVQQQRMFGYTQEELRLLIAPMARTGVESLGSMGTDTPVAGALRPAAHAVRLLQAAVRAGHEPAARRASSRSSSRRSTRRSGPRATCSTPAPESCRQIVLPYPILDNEELAKLRYIDDGRRRSRASRRSPSYCLYPVAEGGDGCAMAIDNVRTPGERRDRRRREPHHPLRPLRRRRDRRRSRRCSSPRRCTTTSSARRRARGSGSSSRPARRARCTTSRCCSATAPAAINPYLAFDTIARPRAARACSRGITERKAVKNYVKAAGKGILKVMSKMGISTVASYTGAQIFEAVGLEPGARRRVLHRHRVAHRGHRPRRDRRRRSRARHDDRVSRPARGARAPRARPSAASTSGGARASTTSSTPTPSSSSSTRRAPGATTSSSSTRTLVDDQSKRLATLRGLFELRDGVRPPVPIDEVEPVSEIVKRFSTGAMSYGSISKEAHENLAIAMNRHRRQVEHRRGRRGRRPLRARRRTATCGAARSSRSRRAASASRASTS